ncbi:MAG: isoprenylcysteine carboxylmethyltransferase family protein [Schleiferiaceae bacterium]|nr:isoprenylcysteine carboxylmethyltransferase family protein [Schleiferiaceae bacterium]
MALVNDLEKQGNVLFKYRGQFPVFLFVMAVPILFWTNTSFSDTQQSIITATAVFLSVFGFIFRAIAIGTSQKNTSGRNREEQVAEALNTTGLYSTLRHPLYFGNYFMWIGIVLFTFNFWFVLTATLLFWLYYERIMFAEERFLERKFGDAYLKWASTIPAFIPSFKHYIKNQVPFSFKTILRREYNGITATILAFVYVDALRQYFAGAFEWTTTYTIWTIIAIAVTAILRTIKKNTQWLHEPDRS